MDADAEEKINENIANIISFTNMILPDYKINESFFQPLNIEKIIQEMCSDCSNLTDNEKKELFILLFNFTKKLKENIQIFNNLDSNNNFAKIKYEILKKRVNFLDKILQNCNNKKCQYITILRFIKLEYDKLDYDIDSFNDKLLICPAMKLLQPPDKSILKELEDVYHTVNTIMIYISPFVQIGYNLYKLNDDPILIDIYDITSTATRILDYMFTTKSFYIIMYSLATDSISVHACIKRVLHLFIFLLNLFMKPYLIFIESIFANRFFTFDDIIEKILNLYSSTIINMCLSVLTFIITVKSWTNYGSHVMENFCKFIGIKTDQFKNDFNQNMDYAKKFLNEKIKEISNYTNDILIKIVKKIKMWAKHISEIVKKDIPNIITDIKNYGTQKIIDKITDAIPRNILFNHFSKNLKEMGKFESQSHIFEILSYGLNEIGNEEIEYQNEEIEYQNEEIEYQNEEIEYQNEEELEIEVIKDNTIDKNSIIMAKDGFVNEFQIKDFKKKINAKTVSVTMDVLKDYGSEILNDIKEDIEEKIENFTFYETVFGDSEEFSKNQTLKYGKVYDLITSKNSNKTTIKDSLPFYGDCYNERECNIKTRSDSYYKMMLFLVMILFLFRMSKRIFK